ncbi:MAG: Rrf2 family transcriptional regulator [Acidobacteria bacterium]|nr:Rrf2 family transcriptional regulator [Acidobacteriota bacterium]
MIAKTSHSALRTLLLLAQQDPAVCWSPRRLADMLGESPTYLAKVVRHLVKSDILEAQKGVKGGVRLVKAPAQITLLDVVEACQGTIVGDFCRSSRPDPTVCGFHRAAVELHQAITTVLGRWTLAQLLEQPRAVPPSEGGFACLMAHGLHAVAAKNRPPSPFTQLGGVL